MTTDQPVNVPLPRHPYRGLEPFRYIDAPIFQARARESRELIRTVILYRGALLYGTSGTGKSSLVNAGLLPAAVREGFSPVRIRLQPEAQREIVVERIGLMDDGDVSFLPSEFIAGVDAGPRALMSIAEFRERLFAYAVDHHPLLVFDQFEEFVTRFEEITEGRSRAALLEVQQAVLALLLECLRDERLPIKLLFVFREDYLPKLNLLFAQAPELRHQFLRLTSPPVSELLPIIRGPFKNPALRAHFGKEISETVAQDLAAEIVLRNADGLINLSELQLASLELWLAADPAVALREQHVQGLVESFLERTIAQIRHLQVREAAIASLGEMVTPSGLRNTISEYNLIRNIQVSRDLAPQQIRDALQILVNSRLVRRELQGDAHYYEIASEFLSEWINRQRAVLREQEIARTTSIAVSRTKRRAASSAVVFSILMALAALSVGYRLQVQRDQGLLRDTEARVAQLQAENERIGAIAELLASRGPEFSDEESAMFGSSTLDVALGLTFVYVLFSLVCMGVHELLAATVNLRAKTLWSGIRQLIEDDVLARELYAHPLIKTLNEPGLLTRLLRVSSMPAYIDPAAFAAALVDTLAPVDSVLEPERRMGAVLDRVARMSPGDFRRTMLLLANESGLDLRAFQAEVASWFQRSMDSVAGRYKLGVQWRLLAVGAVLAVTLNLDTFLITNQLGANQSAQRVFIAEAQARIATPDKKAEEAFSTQQMVANQKQLLDGLKMTLGFPIGWRDPDEQRIDFRWAHVPGWIVSALALSFLAPLWFDVLNRIGIMRSTVKPVERPIDRHSDRVDSRFST